MRTAAPLKAKVQILISDSTTKPPKPKNLHFKLTPTKTPDISETLMTNFSDLDLTVEEKRFITKNQRVQLCHYKMTPQEQYMKCATRLINEINKLKTTSIVIKASEYGTFVCLAAVFSGKICKKKEICFELEAAPIILFPKALLTKPIHSNCDVKIVTHEQSWIKDFESLLYEPSICEQISFVDEDEQLEFYYKAA